MANILITGLRAPGSLEWIRALSKEHTIYGLDFINYPVGRFSNKLTKYFKIVNPKNKNFIKQLLDIINKYHIELIIPTCEEIFHLTKIQLPCPILSSNSIYHLHSKWNFVNTTGFDKNGEFPTTYLEKTESLMNQNLSNFVMKPEYTRFGTEVFIKPKNNNFLLNFKYSKWLKQEFIDGKEICVYLLCQNGKIFDYSFYHPKYKVGKASVYFEWFDSPVLLKTLEEYVKNNNLHGQISFDIIQKESLYYFIECNPRMTSGIHHISHISLLNYINNVFNNLIKCNHFHNYDLTPSMIASMNIFRNEFNIKNDVIWEKNDKKPFYFQLLSTIEFSLKSIYSFKNILKTTTDDISFP